MEVILYSKECNWYTRCCLLNGGVHYRECPLREILMYFYFFSLFQSWEKASSDRYREKLLGLIGKIGKDDRTGKTASKVTYILTAYPLHFYWINHKIFFAYPV